MRAVLGRASRAWLLLVLRSTAPRSPQLGTRLCSRTPPARSCPPQADLFSLADAMRGSEDLRSLVANPSIPRGQRWVGRPAHMLGASTPAGACCWGAELGRGSTAASMPAPQSVLRR